MSAFHINEDELLDLAYGELQGPDGARAEAHLATCAECAQALAGIRGVRRLMAELPHEAPPSTGQDSLFAYATQAAARRASGSGGGRWQRWVAALGGVAALAIVAVVAVETERRVGPDRLAQGREHASGEEKMALTGPSHEPLADKLNDRENLERLERPELPGTLEGKSRVDVIDSVGEDEKVEKRLFAEGKLSAVKPSVSPPAVVAPVDSAPAQSELAELQAPASPPARERSAPTLSEEQARGERKGLVASMDDPRQAPELKNKLKTADEGAPDTAFESTKSIAGPAPQKKEAERASSSRVRAEPSTPMEAPTPKPVAVNRDDFAKVDTLAKDGFKQGPSAAHSVAGNTGTAGGAAFSAPAASPKELRGAGDGDRLDQEEDWARRKQAVAEATVKADGAKTKAPLPERIQELRKKMSLARGAEREQVLDALCEAEMSAELFADADRTCRQLLHEFPATRRAALAQQWLRSARSLESAGEKASKKAVETH